MIDPQFFEDNMDDQFRLLTDKGVFFCLVVIFIIALVWT